MEDKEYTYLHELPKELDDIIHIAAPKTQSKMQGHGKFESKERFTVFQNRKGHHRKNNLTYLLKCNNGIMIRIDINGKVHEHVPTPHVHIFDKSHNEGSKAIPLSDLKNYPYLKDDIEKSLKAFLTYNNFEIKGLQVSRNLV